MCFIVPQPGLGIMSLSLQGLALPVSTQVSSAAFSDAPLSIKTSNGHFCKLLNLVTVVSNLVQQDQAFLVSRATLPLVLVLMNWECCGAETTQSWVKGSGLLTGLSKQRSDSIVLFCLHIKLRDSVAA